MKEIPLTKGRFAIVDDKDYEYLMQWKWHVSECQRQCYAQRTVYNPKRIIKMHRVITDAPHNFEVDHINHNGLDNRRENLRIVTRRENSHNRTDRPKTGYVGVYVKRKRFEAKIQINGDSIYLGTFDTPERANEAYLKAITEQEILDNLNLFL